MNQWLDGPIQSRYWRPTGIIQWPSRRRAERLGTRPHGRRLAHDHATATKDHLFENCVNYGGHSLQTVLRLRSDALRTSSGYARSWFSGRSNFPALVAVARGAQCTRRDRRDTSHHEMIGPQTTARRASAHTSSKGISGSKPSGSRAPPSNRTRTPQLAF